MHVRHEVLDVARGGHELPLVGEHGVDLVAADSVHWYSSATENLNNQMPLTKNICHRFACSLRLRKWKTHKTK